MRINVTTSFYIHLFSTTLLSHFYRSLRFIKDTRKKNSSQNVISMIEFESDVREETFHNVEIKELPSRFNYRNNTKAYDFRDYYRQTYYVFKRTI